MRYRGLSDEDITLRATVTQRVWLGVGEVLEKERHQTAI